MENLYKGTGSSKDYKHSLDFLDTVFFLKENGEKYTEFLSLLPKLYKEECNHCEKNYIVSENGEWKGAVGLYFDEVDVCGNMLKCGGIGNVAVSKDSRGKGYMKDCLNLAINKAVEENADFMALGGQRQRYGYFGFEPIGIDCTFAFNKINFVHTYGKDYAPEVALEQIGKNDSYALDFIYNLHQRNPFKFVRKREKLYDILVSWHQKPYVFKIGNELVGYCVISESGSFVEEIMTVDLDSFKKAVPALLSALGKDELKFNILVHEKEYMQYLTDICEEAEFGHCEMLSVLNYSKVVAALMEYTAKCRPLCDGEQAFTINGFKNTETFTIKVENGIPTVCECGENPLELSHKQAMQFFFGRYSSKRIELSANASQWFPLNFIMLSSDKV